MSIRNEDKASILIEALPYIQKYHGKTVVIKYGGNAMLSDELRDAVISDIVYFDRPAESIRRHTVHFLGFVARYTAF